MARLPRIDIPGIPQHLIVRGNNRCDIFHDDADRMIYLSFLDEGLREHACDLHAYVLMTNHVHLLATSHREGEFSALMQFVGRKFVRLMNMRWGRTGTLFEGRFRSCPVDSETYVLACMRYIELNPVRAGVVPRPEAFPWSSYMRNAGGSPGSPLVPHEVYNHLGRDSEERGRHYHGLIAEGIPGSELEKIRASARQGRSLGSDEFNHRLQGALRRPVSPVPRGRPRKRGQKEKVT